MNIEETDSYIKWTSGMEVDADGSPNAYSENGGLDYLANAGSPGNWYGLACDSNGNPYIQNDNDPSPGKYVSTTALQDHSKNVNDPYRYVDSGKIPYISIPRELKEQGIKLGDLCMVLFKNNSCAAIIADIGPKGKYGEGSIYLANKLEIPNSPKHGGISSGVTFIIFKNTAAGIPWPRDLNEIEDQAAVNYNTLFQ